MFEVVICGIIERGVAEVMKETIEKSDLPDSMWVEIREADPMDELDNREQMEAENAEVFDTIQGPGTQEQIDHATDHGELYKDI